jgi:UrcA family protein
MKTLLSLAALAAAFTSLPASAQSAAPASVAVSTADLDLHSPAGIAALDRRIQVAIRTLCGEASDVDVHGKNAVGRCRAETLATIAPQRAQAIALARRSTSTVLASQ